MKIVNHFKKRSYFYTGLLISLALHVVSIFRVRWIFYFVENYGQMYYISGEDSADVLLIISSFILLPGEMFVGFFCKQPWEGPGYVPIEEIPGLFRCPGYWGMSDDIFSLLAFVLTTVLFGLAIGRVMKIIRERK